MIFDTTTIARSTLLHKMSRTETVDTKVVGLHGRHPLLVCEGLELRTSEERVFLCLAQTTTGE